MKIVPCNGPFGAEILELDVRDITDQELAECNLAQQQHGVIFFRDQKLSCQQHIDFAERFGAIVVNRFFERLEDYPQVAVVRKEPTHATVVGEQWHTDHSYDQEPARGSILYAREVPSQGGDTCFINMHQVYESLSDGFKQTLEGLQAAHSSRHVFGPNTEQVRDERYNNPEQALQDSIHPLVITHPLSDLKVLYANPDFTTHIVGWSAEESEALLDYIYSVAMRPQNILRFQWQTDSIAFWDNRATWHRAQNDYPGERRLMHRITLAGCAIH
ncbi:MAG: TauD/TfdA dioxygenase family protein [bacterium]